jgi:hippurate hydrolase
MAIINRIAGFHKEMTEWRRELHKHPETAYEEVWTSNFVAERLESFGIKVHRGLAETGVVGVLKGNGGGDQKIALRADMDALDLTENNDFEHKSLNPGKMHGCGHDGHTTMLLGAAKYLAETRNFDGIVYFIFQPAEETEGGGRRMVEEGLFEKFPAESVWGMHNWPGMPVGTFAARSGPMMAAYDMFEIDVTGVGGHGAMPHLGVDPVLVASQIVVALQSIASRNINPMESVVVSVTQIHGGDAYNVIPQMVQLAGTCRAFSPKVHDRIEPRMRQICESIAEAFGATAELRYEKRYPPTINSVDETEIAAAVAADISGVDFVIRDPEPSMGAEDFAFMLQEKPGSYVWIGNGPAGQGEQLHNQGYDFNDEALPIGASYWSRLVETQLARAG